MKVKREKKRKRRQEKKRPEKKRNGSSTIVELVENPRPKTAAARRAKQVT